MYRFVSGSIPKGYRLFSESLYHQQAHRLLQAASGWKSYYLLKEKNKAVVGVLHFHLEKNVAMSPYRAPFGGLELATAIARKVIIDFWKFVIDDLAESGITRIIVRNPSHLVSGSNLIEEVMVHVGFQVEQSEASSLILVSDDFKKQLHYSERKRLNKCNRSGFVAKVLLPGDLKKTYQFIEACRLAKNYKLSLSWKNIQKLASTFPERVVCFGVFNKREMIAASMVIVVNDQVVYDFYHDHVAEYNDFSPVVALLACMNDWCLENNFQQIDLGTSMIGDQINTGLYQFKLKLGAQPAARNTFVKVLS